MTNGAQPDPSQTDVRPAPGRARELGAAGAAATGAGAALVATAATACCAGPVVAPLIVGVLGASGAAWAAGLKPYSPWLLSGSFVLLAYSSWSVYRVPKGCDVGQGGGRNRGRAAVKGVLWLAAALWLGAVAVNVFLGP